MKLLPKANLGVTDADHKALSLMYPDIMGKRKGKKMGKKRGGRGKKGKGKGKGKGKRKGMGISGVGTKVAKAVKMPFSEEVLKGAAAGAVGNLVGNIVGGLIGKKFAERPGAKPESVMFVTTATGALSGAVAGVLTGNMVFKSPAAAKIAAGISLGVAFDRLIGHKAGKVVGLEGVYGYRDGMGQLRLPEDVDIGIVRVPEDETPGGQPALGYEEPDTIEEADLGQYSKRPGVFG